MKDKDCIFCKIAAGEIPSATVYEDDAMRVILDLGPASNGHALILPKEHYKDVTQVPQELAGKVVMLGARLGSAMMKGLGAAGFNLVMNTGRAAGQTVFHQHTHVIPRYEGGPAMVAWTPGKVTRQQQQETAAKIRENL